MRSATSLDFGRSLYCHSNWFLPINSKHFVFLKYSVLYCICSHAEHVEALVKLDTYSSQFLPAYPSGHASHVGRPSSSRKHVGLNLKEKPKILPTIFWKQSFRFIEMKIVR